MKFLVFLFMLSFSFSSFSQDDNLTIVAVGEATLEKDKMIIQDPFITGQLTSAQKSAAMDLVKLMRNDFSFYQKKFFLLEAAPNNTAFRQTTNYDYWNTKGIRYLGTASIDKSGDLMKVSTKDGKFEVCASGDLSVVQLVEGGAADDLAWAVPMKVIA